MMISSSQLTLFATCMLHFYWLSATTTTAPKSDLTVQYNFGKQCSHFVYSLFPQNKQSQVYARSARVAQSV
jgi:hypothetical protein